MDWCVEDVSSRLYWDPHPPGVVSRVRGPIRGLTVWPIAAQGRASLRVNTRRVQMQESGYFIHFCWNSTWQQCRRCAERLQEVLVSAAADVGLPLEAACDIWLCKKTEMNSVLFTAKYNISCPMPCCRALIYCLKVFVLLASEFGPHIGPGEPVWTHNLFPERQYSQFQILICC